MLAFLGAIICIIASVYPGFGKAPPPSSSLNESLSSATMQHSGSSPEVGYLSALHGTEAANGGQGLGRGRGFGLSAEAPTFNGLSGQHQPEQQFSFSRMICTPIPADQCKSKQDSKQPQSDDPTLYSGEDYGYLRSTADQLRQTVLSQKDQILNDQETIRELTNKLNECENGLEERSVNGKSLAGTAAALWGSRRDTSRMVGDRPQPAANLHTIRAVEQLEQATRHLKDRIEKLEQDLLSQANSSTHLPGAPWPPADSMHWKMEDLEGQLQQKMLQLQKEKASLLKDSEHNRHEIDQGLNTLHHRVTELEKASEYKLPEGYKISFPVRTNYMYAVVRYSIPELYAFTACLWLLPRSATAIGTPFSYSVPGQANEIVLLQGVHNPVELLINDKVAQLPLQLADAHWHHICVTWTIRDGVWQAYQDGELKGKGENLAPWHPIKPGGVLILGQEQDTLGGRFDATQALVGELAQFNLWDRVLTPSEIHSLADCTETSMGNVASWDDRHIDVFGGATKWPFESCQERRQRGPPDEEVN
ncbi:neuronal pentraxin receptor b [Erpetoichthys calabaricus]|uniref:Neuronal pentraxin receptor b n=1 Tax=Erpetoichthys calabaricus TaxID=27687 RepID=A0A8C4SDC5_ERPCA|nr:neuronal pentraxin receptor b [Erpetoichthys calabaricus]